MYYFSDYDSPVGRLTVAGTEKNIVGLWIEQQRYFMDVLAGRECCRQETAPIRLAGEWLDRYFRGERPPIEGLPIELIGSGFQKAVWQILAQIPYGQVTTYGRIAAQIAAQRGLPAMSAQAVGGAVGRNPISIIIPCHRVVGANGSLTGYSGGIHTKAKLLAFEGADLTALMQKTTG